MVFLTTRHQRAQEQNESALVAAILALTSEDRSQNAEPKSMLVAQADNDPNVSATTTAKSSRAKRGRSRRVTRSVGSSKVKKASNTIPVDKVSRDAEHYEENPMDGDFIIGDERTHNRKYAKLWTRLLRIFRTIAQQLETEGRLNAREIDMDSLPLLVAAVTGGRFGLMQDLATCKEKLGMSETGDAKWGNERPVEELLNVLEIDVADNTSLVAVDEGLKVETRKDEKR